MQLHSFLEEKSAKDYELLRHYLCLGKSITLKLREDSFHIFVVMAFNSTIRLDISCKKFRTPFFHMSELFILKNKRMSIFSLNILIINLKEPLIEGVFSK